MSMNSPNAFHATAAAVALSQLVFATAALGGGLNDTGQALCYDTSHASAICSVVVGGDDGANPRQDARYGREAQVATGTLAKVGGGAAGFDFTKIANNGSSLAASAALGSNSTDWACTKDNVTGLVWEVKTANGLRSQNHTYAWYFTGPSNGGEAGGLGVDTCGGTLSAVPYNSQCNTQNYVAAVNVAGLCGASDWRLPTRRELLSLMNSGASEPTVDTTYFPNSNSALWWTSTTFVAAPIDAWFVDFFSARSVSHGKTSALSVRLVRGGS